MKRLGLLLLLLPRLVFAACTTTDSYSTTVCNDSPVHYYRLSETSSTYADSVTTGSVVGNDDGGGNTRGQPGITCCTNLAVKMAGGSSSSGVTYDTSAAFSPSTTSTQGWSGEVWAFPTSSTANFIFTRGESGAFAYNVTQQASNTIEATLFTCAGANYGITGNDGVLKQNAWNHIVLTTVGAGGGAITNMKLYLNGTLLETVTSFSGTYCSGAVAHASTGRRDDIPTTVTFTGTLDEQAYYTSALSQSQVTAHFNAGLGAHPDWPYTVKRGPNVLRWLLDDGKSTSTQPLESWILSSAGAGH